MFGRLLWESFARQRRRKLLAGIAILLGTTAVTAMLALATTIGDRIHCELAVYGANIVVTPIADELAVKVGNAEVKPSTGGAYLRETDLDKLKTIFWANNITGISPELSSQVHLPPGKVNALGLWFHKPWAAASSGGFGAPALHPSWKLQGRWPSDNSLDEAAIGAKLAQTLGLREGGTLPLGGQLVQIVGVVTTGNERDGSVLLPLALAQKLAGRPGAIDRIEISARTKPEDAFARQDPDAMPARRREIWYCSPYANSIAYQIREAIPGADAQQVRQVEQSEGSLLSKIGGLMWLVSGAALLAAGFAVSAAMATAVLERRGEIGLMRSLGASQASIALLFYAETSLLALIAGSFGYLFGSALAYWLGNRIFAGDGGGATALLNPVLLPVVVAMALIVAVAGSTPAIRKALRMDPSAVLRSNV